MFKSQLSHKTDLEESDRTHGARMSPGQASLLQALFSLEHPPSDVLDKGRSQSRITTALALNTPLEALQCTLYSEPVLDHGLESNSLPFVLYSYSAWMNRMLFDPARVMSQTRNYVIRHYYESEASRRLVVLIANILKSIAANPNTDPGYVHKASALLQLIHRSLSRIASRPLNPSREVDAREATKGLYHTIELMSATRFAPLQVPLELLRTAAPVFRRALSGPLDERVHLATALLHLEPNIRHYPVVDVVYSMVSGLPTNIKYDTSWCSGNINYAALLDDSSHLGMSWLIGLPDQLVVILARINVLSQEDGGDADIEMHEIEENLQQLTTRIEEHSCLPECSSDPRAAVPKAWCMVAYIYFYLSVCGVDASDPRVIHAQQTIMEIIQTSEPSLRLDTHLSGCILFAGIVTSRSDERHLIITRLTNLPESALSDNCFVTGILALQDLWARVDTENRPAEWSDYRLAAMRIAKVG
ncbi:unnamed protein product [Rhizoctonia solani]|uniref:Uncharacterized protein n=1 Tax=Rhizoctonia solani TaxID=456999 RepID=A0A8H3GKL3_9AGAM|nr:unnamed protein product [Rhizoctonia solani]